MLYALDLYEDLSPTTSANSDDPASPSISALAELSEVYRQLGFDAGYAQATRDHLEMFVANAESVLGERSGAWAERDAARRLLYRFIARLERRMGHFARDVSGNYSGENGNSDSDRPLVTTSHYEVAGGLGI